MGANIVITGVAQAIRGRYTNPLGWLPGIAVVDIVPQALAFELVSVSFGDGYGNFIVLQDCRITRVRFLQAKRGRVMRLWIKDRRWRWEGLGEVSGTYNIKDSDGTVVASTEKTPQQLLSLVLDALGETGYSVTAMPNTPRPFVNWYVTVPASAGDQLLDECGCDIAYNPFTNTMGVVQLGAGVLPSFTDVQFNNTGIENAETPGSVVAIAGRTSYQCKVKLKPKAIEPDGTVVDADDASYKPAGGWTDEDDPSSVLAGGDVTDRAAANGSVFYIWGLDTFSDGSLNLPGFGAIGSMDRLVIRDTLNASYDEGDGKFELLPYLEGVAADDDAISSLENTEEGERIKVGFKIDRERNLIITDRPLYKYVDAGGIDFADVYLVASFTLRDTAFRFHQWYVERTLSGAPASPPKVVTIDDVHLTKTATYEADHVTVDTVEDNETEVNDRLNEAIDAVVSSYVTTSSGVVQTSFIKQYATSGLIRQVSWWVSINIRNGMDCVTTTVNINTESEPGMPLPKERRRRIYQQETHRHRRFDNLVRHRRLMNRKDDN